MTTSAGRNVVTLSYSSNLLEQGALGDVGNEQKFGVPNSEGGWGFMSSLHADGISDVNWTLGFKGLVPLPVHSDDVHWVYPGLS